MGPGRVVTLDCLHFVVLHVLLPAFEAPSPSSEDSFIDLIYPSDQPDNEGVQARFIEDGHSVDPLVSVLFPLVPARFRIGAYFRV